MHIVGILAPDNATVGGPDEYNFNAPFTVPSTHSGLTLPNTATAQGTDVLGRAVNDTDPHVVSIFHPCIQITKWHIPSSRPGGVFYAGDKITYMYQVTNCSATVGLHGVQVVDEWIGKKSGARVIQNIPSLAGGTNKGFSWVYTVTSADVALERLENRATAIGVDDCDGTVDDADTEEVITGQPRVFVPEWGSIALLVSGLAPLAGYATLRRRKS